MPRPDANDLGKRLKEGEELAFLDFQYAYRRLFFSYYLRHGIPEFAAEDLTINCITDIPLKANKWDAAKGTFDSWVLSVMRNKGHDWHRQNPSGGVPLNEEITSSDTSEEPIPMSPRAAKRAAELYEKLTALSPHARLVLELRYMGMERTFAEIADALPLMPNGKKINAAYARKINERALERLRKLYGIPATEDEPTEGRSDHEPS